MKKTTIILVSLALFIWSVVLIYGAVCSHRINEVLAQPSISIKEEEAKEEETHICPPAEIIIVEKEVIKEVIVEIEVEKPVYLNPLPVFQITPAERELLAELVYYEARGESFTGKCAVVSVVFNRIKYHGYKDIYSAVSDKNQFSPWGDGEMDGKLTEDKEQNSYYEEIYKAVDFVIWHGVTIDEYVTFFRTKTYHTNTIEYDRIGNHYFSFDKKYYDLSKKGE